MTEENFVMAGINFILDFGPVTFLLSLIIGWFFVRRIIRLFFDEDFRIFRYKKEKNKPSLFTRFLVTVGILKVKTA